MSAAVPHEFRGCLDFRGELATAQELFRATAHTTERQQAMKIEVLFDPATASYHLVGDGRKLQDLDAAPTAEQMADYHVERGNVDNELHAKFAHYRKDPAARAEEAARIAGYKLKAAVSKVIIGGPRTPASEIKSASTIETAQAGDAGDEVAGHVASYLNERRERERRRGRR